MTRQLDDAGLHLCLREVGIDCYGEAAQPRSVVPLHGLLANRLEASPPDARHRDLQPVAATQHRLGAVTVAVVAAPSRTSPCPFHWLARDISTLDF
jgi:hypothetical protein